MVVPVWSIRVTFIEKVTLGKPQWNSCPTNVIPLFPGLPSLNSSFIMFLLTFTSLCHFSKETCWGGVNQIIWWDLMSMQMVCNENSHHSFGPWLLAGIIGNTQHFFKYLISSNNTCQSMLSVMEIKFDLGVVFCFPRIQSFEMPFSKESWNRNVVKVFGWQFISTGQYSI